MGIRYPVTLFRCDGGMEIGMGHIIGSLRLAKLLARQMGVQPFFIIKREEKVEAFMEDAGVPFAVIPEDANAPEQVGRITGIAEAQNARVVVINFNAPDLLAWGDQFGLLKDAGMKIVFMDNPMDSSRYGEVVINALPHPEYPRLDHPARFEGLKYLIFDGGYNRFASKKRTLREPLERILISMGGGDHKNLTVCILEFLIDMGCDAEIDVVLGAVSANMAHVKPLLSKLNGKVSINVKDMAERIWEADLGFTSLGLTTYEMAYLGLPAIIIAPHSFNGTVADLYCKRYAFAHYCGLAGTVQMHDIQRTFQGMRSNFQQVFQMIQKQRQLVFQDPFTPPAYEDALRHRVYNH